MRADQANRIIQLLEEMNQKLDKMVGTQPNLPQINTPFFGIADPCTDGGIHVYPLYWNSILPAPCTKCGKTPASPFIVTSGNSVLSTADQNNSSVTTLISKATPTAKVSNCADPVSFCSDCKCGKKARHIASIELKSK